MQSILKIPSLTLKEALSSMSKSGEKCIVVVDEDKKLLGTLSDGDIRKSILSGKSLDDSIEHIYQRNCTSLNEENYSDSSAKEIFSSKRIDLIPLVNKNNKVVDIIYWEHFLSEDKQETLDVDIPVVIMAGGSGTRLAPFTNVLPKPLIPIGEETIIEKIISKFTSVGLDQFYFTVNFKSKLLKAFFEELDPPYKFEFIDESEPLGTAGSLSLLKNKLKKPFFVSNCDIIIDCDYSDIYSFHIENKFDLTLVASAKNYEIPYGTCVLSDGKLQSIQEKPSHNYLVNTGLYLINSPLISLIPEDSFYDMTDLLQDLLDKDINIGVYTVDEESWIDIGQWSEYKKTLEIFN